MTAKKNDPLDELFIDKGDFDRAILAETLIKYVGLTKEGEMIFKSPFRGELDNKKRVLVVLELKNDNAKSKLGPKEISEISGIPHGSVKPAVTELYSKNLIKKDGNEYFVPTYAMNEVRELIKSADGKTQE